MFDPLICAARYQFLKEVWAGRDRVVYDPSLVEWLGSSAAEGDARWKSLLAEVLPSNPSGSVVWAVVRSEAEVVRYAPSLGGCRLVTVEQAFDLGADALWSVAMVDLSGGVEAPVHVEEASAPLRCQLELAGLVERFVEELGRGRTITVSVGGGVVRTCSGDDIALLFEELVPEANSYVVATPTVAAVYPLDGEGHDEDQDDDEDEGSWVDVSEPTGLGQSRRSAWNSPPRSPSREEPLDYDQDLAEAEESWTGQWDRRPTRPRASPQALTQAPSRPVEEEMAVGHDNTLGDQDPEAREWLAVLGRFDVADEAMLVELGSTESGAKPLPLVAEPLEGEAHRRRGQSDDSAQVRELKARLNQARLRADAAVIEHQRLTDVVHGLQQQSEHPQAPDADVGALEAELEAARWSLVQASEQIDALRGRPVSELEAMVCSLRAQLDRRGVDGASAHAGGRSPRLVHVARDRESLTPAADDAPTGAEPRPQPASREATHAGVARRARERAALKSLLRKLERGGGSAFEFHAELRAVLAMIERS